MSRRCLAAQWDRAVLTWWIPENPAALVGDFKEPRQVHDRLASVEAMKHNNSQQGEMLAPAARAFRCIVFSNRAYEKATRGTDHGSKRDGGGGMAYLDAEGELSGHYVLDHWHGRHSLPRSYWINGGLIGGGIGVVLPITVEALLEFTLSVQLTSVISLLVMIVGLGVWLWSIVGIWRSATRHSVRGGHATWARVAQGMVILGLLGLIGRGADTVKYAAETASLAFGQDSFGAPASVTHSGAALHLEGTLALGSASALKKALNLAPDARVLRLTSIGGRLGEAEQIAALVRARGMETLVDGECLSACTFILVAGSKRSQLAGARIGFHQPSYPGLDGAEQAHPHR